MPIFFTAKDCCLFHKSSRACDLTPLSNFLVHTSAVVKTTGQASTALDPITSRDYALQVPVGSTEELRWLPMKPGTAPHHAGFTMISPNAIAPVQPYMSHWDSLSAHEGNLLNDSFPFSCCAHPQRSARGTIPNKADVSGNATEEHWLTHEASSACDYA